MPLKPQDVVVLLKYVIHGRTPKPFGWYSRELGISVSEVHGGVKRLVAAGLLRPHAAGLAPVRQAINEFLVAGARYCFFPVRGGLVRGMPTGFAAIPGARIKQERAAPLPVWPYVHGRIRGLEFSPLYPSVPGAARKDPHLYQMLALFDALRGGQARERALAAAMMERSLKTHFMPLGIGDAQP